MRDNRDIFFVDFGSMPQENVSFQQLFEQGLASQQQKNWEAALGFYQEALDKGLTQISETQASAIYHNMSTVAYEKADFLKAYIWSKKAIVLNPGNKIAQQSFEQFSKKFEPPQIAHQISGSENLVSILRLVSVDVLSVTTLILFFSALWLFFKNLMAHKKNKTESNIEAVGFPWLASILGILTLTCFIFTWILWKDESTLRGLIIAEKTAVQTAPGENKSVIFEVQPGTEVEVLQTQEGYLQVRYPGAFSGWVPQKNVEVLSIAK